MERGNVPSFIASAHESIKTESRREKIAIAGKFLRSVSELSHKHKHAHHVAGDAARICVIVQHLYV